MRQGRPQLWGRRVTRSTPTELPCRLDYGDIGQSQHPFPSELWTTRRVSQRRTPSRIHYLSQTPSGYILYPEGPASADRTGEKVSRQSNRLRTRQRVSKQLSIERLLRADHSQTDSSQASGTAVPVHIAEQLKVQTRTSAAFHTKAPRDGRDDSLTALLRQFSHTRDLQQGNSR